MYDTVQTVEYLPMLLTLRKPSLLGSAIIIIFFVKVVRAFDRLAKKYYFCRGRNARIDSAKFYSPRFNPFLIVLPVFL